MCLSWKHGPGSGSVLVELTRAETLMQHLPMQIPQASASSDLFERGGQHRYLDAALPSTAAGLSGAAASEGTQRPRSAALGLAMDTGRKGITRRTRRECRIGPSRVVPCSISGFRGSDSLCSLQSAPESPREHLWPHVPTQNDFRVPHDWTVSNFICWFHFLRLAALPTAAPEPAWRPAEEARQAHRA